jgi:SAM-dependent methyltransferase
MPVSGRWFETAKDPMDPRLLLARSEIVSRARRPNVRDRNDYLVSLASGKRVLDVGVVDHTSTSDRQENWLHGRVVGVAKSTLGVDVLEKGVRDLQARGFNVICHDITRTPLEQEFEFILCGEVIEHLDAPGILLQAAAALLVPGGTMAITTPNPFALWRVMAGVRGRTQQNVDHTVFLEPWGMAEYAERAGLRMTSFRGVDHFGNSLVGRFLLSDFSMKTLKLAPEARSETIIYEFVKSPADE